MIVRAAHCPVDNSHESNLCEVRHANTNTNMLIAMPIAMPIDCTIVNTLK